MDEIPEEPYPEKEDEEVVKRAKEFEKLLTDELEEYEKTEEDLETLLRKDHELCEETMDLWSFLTLTLAAKEGGEVSEETIETVYLSLVDKYAELSKIFHPLSEMGMDRLWAALSIAERYEKEYRPLLTQVTANNVEKFGRLLKAWLPLCLTTIWQRIRNRSFSQAAFCQRILRRSRSCGP